MDNKEVYYKLYLGLNYLVSLKSPFGHVNFKRLLTPNVTSVQFYDLLRFKLDEWIAFYNVISKLNLSELNQFKPCYMQHNLDMFQCPICVPT